MLLRLNRLGFASLAAHGEESNELQVVTVRGLQIAAVARGSSNSVQNRKLSEEKCIEIAKKHQLSLRSHPQLISSDIMIQIRFRLSLNLREGL